MPIRHGSSKPGPSAKSPAKKAEPSHRASEVLSIFVFALSVFTLLALVTYNSGDPSLFSNVQGVPTNMCGRAGSYLASLMLQYFGIGAFLLPVALFFISAAIFKREGQVRLVGTMGGMAVAVMSLTVFATLQWKYLPYAGTLLLTGGAFGAWVAEILVRQFNPVGSSIVSLFVFCAAIALSTPLSIARFGAYVLSRSGLFAWRVTKLVGTYLIYLGGLAAMRLAHSLGDLLQRLIEGAITRAKTRAAEAKAMAAQAKLNPPMKEIESDVIKTGAALEEADEDDADAEPADVDAIEQIAETVVQNALASGLVSEAPNALEGMAPTVPPPGARSAGDGATSAGPAIMPREHLTPVTADSANTMAGKAATKLANFKNAQRKRGNWKLPSVDFLRKPPKIESTVDKEKLLENSKILRQKFADFGIDGEVTAVRPGPVITLYEFKPGPGIKVSRIAALADDLSMALSAQSVRILAPLPGKSVVGIEIPSDQRETVYLREFLQNPDFHGQKHMIPIAMGKDIAGQPYLSDLYRMPHLLTAGQTGAGKSVFMNGLICSLLYRFTPDELRMILVDPKFIEFRAYQDMPHLLLPVVDNPAHASTALKWAVREMDRRYRILAKIGSKNLAAFNQKVEEMGSDVISDLLLAEENQGESPMATAGSNDWIEAFEPDESGAPRVGKLPYIVIIIDELADLMMIARKEVEISIARIAQKARAAGIHMIVATQRPSTDVVTGLIKANLPSRVSFSLASYIDSKTILDRAGAERLLGQGDMLFIPPGVGQPVRLHGAYVEDDEINKITAFLKAQGKPAYRDEILIEDEEDSEEELTEDGDELWEEAIELVKRSGHASASFLQRHLKVGYNRAARMIETMESRGIVGPADGSRPREVLVR